MLSISFESPDQGPIAGYLEKSVALILKCVFGPQITPVVVVVAGVPHFYLLTGPEQGG